MISFKDLLDESLRKPPVVDMVRQMRNHMAFTSGQFNRMNDTWDVVGVGAGGSVFHRPGDKFVIKVFDQEDMGYKRWLAFSLQNQSNSFVPKIIGRPTPINKELAFVRLELLKELTNHNHMFVENWWMEYRRSFRRFKSSTPPPRSENRLIKSDWPLKKQDVNDYIKVMTFIDNHTSNDVRRDNYLERPNGELVITDPLYGSRSDERNTSKYGREIHNFLRSRYDSFAMRALAK